MTLEKAILAILVTAISTPLLGCLEPECPPEFEAPDRPPDLRVISYNIGNGISSGNYPLRLMDQAYEDHLGAKIREQNAQIVALQEVLPQTTCAVFDETNERFTCYDWAKRPSQIERLMGEDYSIVCDSNLHVECVAVHRDFGQIRGLALGGFDLNGAKAEPLPMEPCVYFEGECSGAKALCDTESSISSLIVDSAMGPLIIIHAHPTAVGTLCRQEQIKQAFALSEGLPAVLLGDWNFDPTAQSNLAEAALWSKYVGDDLRFTEHNERRSGCRLESSKPGGARNLDRVVTDFTDGICNVREDPRFDEPFDFASMEGGRADHLAIQCDLYYLEDFPWGAL